MNFNKVLLGGYLTRDPELKYAPSGSAICNFSIGTNRTWSDQNTGEKKSEATFVECTAFGKTGESIAQYFKKGNPIFVEGRLKLDQWEDRQTQQKRQKLSVVAEHFKFVGNKDQAQAPAGRSSQPAPSNDNDGASQPDDDVPF